MIMNTTKVVNPTKVKGLLKGLRYISQIFDEEKEEELQIGVPTDVKHVAHIGSDGPSSNDAPSWMKEFKPSSPTTSSPVSNKGDESDVKWVSEDSKRGNKASNSPKKGTQEGPRSTRRHHSSEGSHSPRRNQSTKARSSRRNKEASEGSVKFNHSGQTSDVPPDVRKKTRRKKSKESESGHGSTQSKTKGSGSVDLADDESVSSRKSIPQEGDE